MKKKRSLLKELEKLKTKKGEESDLFADVGIFILKFVTVIALIYLSWQSRAMRNLSEDNFLLFLIMGISSLILFRFGKKDN